MLRTWLAGLTSATTIGIVGGVKARCTVVLSVIDGQIDVLTMEIDSPGSSNSAYYYYQSCLF